MTPDVQSKPESAPASTSHHAAPVSIEDSGIELSGIDDNGVSASQIDDNGIELSGIELNGIEESGIELSGIDDNGVPFTPIELSGIELSGIELSGAALGAIELSGIELNGIDDNGIELSGIDDNGIDDNGAPVTSIELNGIELSGIELNGIELSGLALRSIELNGIELSGIELNGIELSGIELNGIDDNGTPRSVTSINVNCSRSAGVQPGMIVAMIWHQSRPIDDKGIDESGVEPKAIDDNGIDDRGVPSTSIDDNGACAMRPAGVSGSRGSPTLSTCPKVRLLRGSRDRSAHCGLRSPFDKVAGTFSQSATISLQPPSTSMLINGIDDSGTEFSTIDDNGVDPIAMLAMPVSSTPISVIDDAAMLEEPPPRAAISVRSAVSARRAGTSVVS